jgi:hypothetical protein
MPSISDLLRSLGNAGALTNVRTVLDEQTREDWLVAGLALRLDERDQPKAAITPAAPPRPGVATPRVAAGALAA